MILYEHAHNKGEYKASNNNCPAAHKCNKKRRRTHKHTTGPINPVSWGGQLTGCQFPLLNSQALSTFIFFKDYFSFGCVCGKYSILSQIFIGNISSVLTYGTCWIPFRVKNALYNKVLTINICENNLMPPPELRLLFLLWSCPYFFAEQ